MDTGKIKICGTKVKVDSFLKVSEIGKQRRHVITLKPFYGLFFLYFLNSSRCCCSFLLGQNEKQS
jgi:hypothetical protein